jgi:fermentation-respiration switch protein FrsA (DUF1100 family)
MCICFCNRQIALFQGQGYRRVATRGELAGMIGTLLFVVGMMYGAFCLYLYMMQGRMIFYPVRKLTSAPTDIGLHYESVSLTTSDGIKLHGWFVPAAAEKGALLFFHGNAGNISHRLDSLKIFHDLGLSTLIIDYRGYGESDGSISEKGTYVDADAAWDYLARVKDFKEREIIVFGRSLGGAVAAHVASLKRPGGLILESAFTSVPDMGARMYPYLPVRFLSRFKYDARKALQSVTCPVLIIHSPQDDIIPFENGLQLYKSARQPKRFLEIRGDHNEGFYVSGKMYIHGINDFITSALSDGGRGNKGEEQN